MRQNQKTYWVFTPAYIFTYLYIETNDLRQNKLRSVNSYDLLWIWLNMFNETMSDIFNILKWTNTHPKFLLSFRCHETLLSLLGHRGGLHTGAHLGPLAVDLRLFPLLFLNITHNQPRSALNTLYYNIYTHDSIPIPLQLMFVFGLIL